MVGYKTKVKRMIKKTFECKVPAPYPVLAGGGLLDRRCALITGGGSGIGYAIAEQFVKNKASVILVGRNEKRLQDAVKALEKMKTTKEQRIDYFKMDVSDIEGIDDKIDGFLDKNRDIKIDILVNNAGIASGDKFGTATVDGFERIFKTNVEGTYFVSQKIYNYMKKNKIKGNILNVLSSSSKRPASSPYTMSKWALSGLTLGMAKVCIRDGIVVNAVAPGLTATKIQLENPRENIANSRLPMERYIMPEEIANIAVMLVSDLGRCIIGDTVYATGGSGVVTVDDIDY